MMLRGSLLATALLAALNVNVSTARAEENAVVLTADTPWVVADGEPEAVGRALADVQRDWYKVFGHRPIVLRQPPAEWTGPLVYLGTKGPWLKELQPAVPPGAECFVLRVRRDAADRPAIVATGADVRGAIYAAYALSEEILGVDPWYYWTDHEPAARRRIDVPGDLDKQFGPATFRYRGWFINDEDLLAGFAPDALRENVFSLEMLDRICETLLRLRGNMIVPGTFNFPDERCWEVASRRGLALNMHHILVVGLNTFRWPKDVPFSYAKHPEIMDRYWRDCIAAFKGREVVWTVGYRGRHDRPFWEDEPELKTPAARGEVITKAIARQVELIREADPHAMIIANLWMEGAEMMQAGHLKLPAGVVLVWPDDGSGIIRDRGAVQAGQGVYYHTAMLNGGSNQLSEMVNPGRIYDEIGRFARAGATSFLLVNVSDVRPVPLSTDCVMRLAWNAAPYRDKTSREKMDAFLADWSRRQFGEPQSAEIAAIYNRYFEIPYQRHGERHGDNYLHAMLRLLSPTAPDKARAAETFAAANRKYVAELLKSAEPLAEKVPADRRDFYRAHVLTPIEIHLYSLAMLESYAAAMLHQDAAKADEALRAADDLFDAMRRGQNVKWAAWYFGERFVAIEVTRDRVRALAAKLRGEPAPPVRPRLDYPELYRYQEPFLPNFPRMYPHTSSEGGEAAPTAERK